MKTQKWLKLLLLIGSVLVGLGVDGPESGGRVTPTLKQSVKAALSSGNKCDSPLYIRTAIRHQMVEAALAGDLNYRGAPDCPSIEPVSSSFDSVEEYRVYLDEEYGLDRLELESIFANPASLVYSMGDAEYVEFRAQAVERGLSAERIALMDRWRRWARQNECFDAMMLSIPRGSDVSAFGHLPTRCEITIEAWQVHPRFEMVVPRSVVWRKASASFRQPPVGIPDEDAVDEDGSAASVAFTDSDAARGERDSDSPKIVAGTSARYQLWLYDKVWLPVAAVVSAMLAVIVMLVVRRMRQ